MTTSLIRYAATAPTFDREKVHRSKLVEAIQVGGNKRLVLVGAPAGYGKTTLLADLHAHAATPTCWVRLTCNDMDVMNFVDIWLYSISRRFRRIRGHLRSDALIGLTPEGMGRTIAKTVEVLIPETFAIVVDDVHLARDSASIAAFLQSWLSRQPPQTTLILSGRDFPLLKLSGLIARDELVTLGARDLALTREELRLILSRRLGRAVDELEVDRFEEETQGWVTGLLLSERLLSSELSYAGQTRWPMVYDYLAAEVFDRLPEDLKTFMAHSSVLPVMTAEACDQVLKRSDSRSMLTRIERESLFVTVTENSTRTYEYQQQLKDFLKAKLEDTSPELVSELTIRSAEYLESIDEPDLAIELYSQTMFERAIRCAETHSPKMSIAGRVHTLEKWARLLDGYPNTGWVTLTRLASKYIDQGKLDRAESLLERIRTWEATEIPAEELAQSFMAHAWVKAHKEQFADALNMIRSAADLLELSMFPQLHAESLRIQSFVQYHGARDLGEAEHLARKAVQLVAQSRDSRKHGLALVDLSSILGDLGRQDEAVWASSAALSLLETSGSPLEKSIALNNLGVLSHSRGDYFQALALLDRSRSFASIADAPMREAYILYSQGDLLGDLGFNVQAAELYSNGLELATKVVNPRRMRFGFLRLCSLFRRLGKLDVAWEWLHKAKCEVAIGGLLSPDIEVQHAALSTADDSKAAQTRLIELLDTSSLYAEDRTLVYYLLAECNFRLGKQATSSEYLTRALEFATETKTMETVAAEMRYNPTFYQYALSVLLTAPKEELVNRIEMGEVFRRKFRFELSEVPSDVITVKALGDQCLTKGANESIQLPPLAFEVLCFILENNPANRHMIVDVFWPNYPSLQQSSNLHAAIYSIRAALGKDALVYEYGCYRLGTRGMRYDVNEFLRESKGLRDFVPGNPGILHRLELVIDSYGGPFLAHCSRTWVVIRRRELEELLISHIASYAEIGLEARRESRIAEILKMGMKIDPYREDLNMLYLQAVSRKGLHWHLAEHYRSYLHLLSSDLGTLPSRRFMETYASLIAQ